MTINRINYEVFLVDYLDGKLNASQIDELLLFLDQNLDIKDELEGMDEAVLVAVSTIFPNKSSLKKRSFLKDGINNEFEYLCIASVEGILTQTENYRLQSIVKEDQSKQAPLLAFQQLKISPDRSITYSDKAWLKRSPILPIRYSNLRLSISIAASIALIVGIYSIGNIMVSNNPLESYSNNNITELTTPRAINKTEEITNKEVAIYKKPIKTFTKRKKESNPIINERVEIKTRINIEESIPNMLHRIDYNRTFIPENHEAEIAKLSAKFAPKDQVLLEELYAQQENNSKRTKNFGAFEAIQYGVRSFGKLFGRDVKLDANKDKKGNIEKIIFESKLVAFSTSLNNND